MANPTAATFLTNAAIFTQPRISERDQRLLRIAAKARCCNQANSGPLLTFATGSNLEWKNLLANSENTTLTGGALTKDQCVAATINSLFFTLGTAQIAFSTARNFILPMVGFQDETRLARIEAFLDWLAYNNVVSGS